jgi:hypothetical protein
MIDIFIIPLNIKLKQAFKYLNTLKIQQKIEITVGIIQPQTIFKINIWNVTQKQNFIKIKKYFLSLMFNFAQSFT